MEEKLQKKELKDFRSRFDKVFSMKISFFKTGKLNGSSYVKKRQRSSAILSIQNDDKYCFICSILAYLYPIADSKYGHAARVSIYRPYLNELNIEGFDFSIGFGWNDVYKFENLKNVSMKIIELSFYQDQNT